jgi:DNA mismatch repair ATPase MutS
VAWVAIQAAVVQRWRRQVRTVLERVDAAAYDLGLLTELIACIERETFASPLLVSIQARLASHGTPPSRLIARLQRYIAARDSLRNELVRPFALLLLVRGQAAVAIDRWHAEHRGALGQWLSAIGDLEACASLATYAFERPASVFPTLATGEPRFHATALAHPLLARSTAVANNVRLGGDAPHVLIVSGSNMSGKSTLLRAVGVNAVLALAGAPVCAESLELSPLAIGATIRVEDSLREGQSRFYTEILRIRDIVTLSRGATSALFLLDEILHGTNSHDRRIGAEAIVRSLAAAGSIGLVTTHDLALTQLVATLGGKAANVHFEDRIVDGKMVFDYRMRDGVVERSNAIELMRSVGIDV